MTKQEQRVSILTEASSDYQVVEIEADTGYVTVRFGASFTLSRLTPSSAESLARAIQTAADRAVAAS